MLIVISALIGGIILGFLLRSVSNLKFLKKLPMTFIFLLLFSLGISVGANRIIMSNLSTIGLQALIITFGTMLGSVLMAWLVYTKFFKKEDTK